MHRNASAAWHGGLKDGKGTVTTHSRTLSDTPYSFGTRFENVVGTNPEELIAAAHAACFSMALSAELEKVGIRPESIHTNATARLENLSDGWRVTEIHLDVKADIPTGKKETFETAATHAKINCPISRLLNTKITMNTRLQEKAA